MKTQDKFIAACLCKPVLIALLDGKQVRGTLLAADAYTLLVRQEREGKQIEVLVYKHAVKYVTR